MEEESGQEEELYDDDDEEEEEDKEERCLEAPFYISAGFARLALAPDSASASFAWPSSWAIGAKLRYCS